jgi:hypothetical protein
MLEDKDELIQTSPSSTSEALDDLLDESSSVIEEEAATAGDNDGNIESSNLDTF